MKIRIATRKSPLALWQANFVKTQLLAIHQNLIVELVPMVTQGDVLLDSPLSKLGGKGLFVKQLEQAILDEQADIAVHSIKDIPTEFPDGLHLATICQRDEVRDAFLANDYNSINDLPLGATVGTSSLRRQCQLKAAFPHLKIKDLRGNVGTRLTKLDNKEYDAIILAAVGLKRLALTDRIKQYLDIELMLPAVGQGAVGIETRVNDQRILELLSPLNDADTSACIVAERAMNKQLNGGCQVPIACYSQLNNGIMTLQGLVGSIDGKKIIKSEVQGKKENAASLGIMLAEQLLQLGAKEILADLTPPVMIIVTRPSPEGNLLTQDLKNNHIPAQHLPLFNIEPGQDLPRLQHELNQLNKGDYVIVVSPQVSHILKSKVISFKPPHHLFYFSVGKKSAELFSQLLNKKIKYPKIEVTYPEQENSEGLLQLLDSKPLKNKNILILRGNSGRELLAEALTKQQAKVKWIECYARKPILYSPADFLVNIHQQMIIITSIENLLQLEYYKLNENKKSTTLIVTSLRIAEEAKILGWQNIELSDGANNKILFKTIESLCNNDK